MLLFFASFLVAAAAWTGSNRHKALLRQMEETPYIGLCTEEHYEEWYNNNYPEECRDLMANATDLHHLFDVYCDPFCGDIYFNYLDNCGSAGIVLTFFYRNFCSENEKGVACYNYIISEELHNPKPEVDEYCSGVNETCTTNCFYALEAMATELGCCVNTIYNVSIPDPSTAYELWDLCNVPTPSFCNDLRVGFSSATALLVSSLNVAAVVTMTMLMVAMK